MPEAQASAKKAPRPIDVLRDRMGGVSGELRDYVKEQSRVKKLVEGALRAGPKTVPEIASECKVEGRVVLWHLMALRRYGRVVEAEIRERYPVYQLKKGA